MQIHSIYRVPLLTAACVLSLQLQAQEAPTQEKIIVTANKFNEDINDVAQSITVIDEVMLEERGITDVNELIRQIPNMHTVQGITGAEVNVRGINASMFTRNNPVVIYVDGIPTSSRYAYNFPFVNIERIEVLRGPQGTLYGKDSIGGVINVVTKQPGQDWESQADAEIGSYNSHRLAFSTAGAVSPDLFSVGLWGELTNNDGWMKNTNANLDDKANHKKNHRLGANLLLTPTENFSARLLLVNEKGREGILDGGTAGTVDGFNNAKRSDFENTNYDQDSYFKTDTNSLGLNLNYQSEYGEFEAITTHRKTKIEYRTDIDYGIGNSTFIPKIGSVSLDGGFSFENLTLESTSQELRWSNQLESGLRWVTGLYFEKEQTDYDSIGSQFAGMNYTNISDNNSQTQAVFGQVTIPFTDNLELLLGSRYQRIKKSTNLDYYFTPVVNGNVTLGKPFSELNSEETWTAFLPKAALNYRFNRDWSAYTSISAGYMPGGFNMMANNADEEKNKFEPQQSLSYEIGTKGLLLDERLMMSAAVFYMDIKDIHAFSFSLADKSFRTFNVEKAHSYGLEVEADYIVNESLQLNAALGVTRAEYGSDFLDTSGQKVKAGNKIERTPAYSLNIGAQYNHASGIYARTDIVNYGKTYFDSMNTLEEGGYTVANLKVGYEIYDGEVYAYVNNLTDTSYKTSGTAYPYGGPIITFGKPREMGIGARYRF
ncbi:TonB-dependent receptor [Vibrio penaeicida]|uniref:TonB-dependent receptor n=1 Tax=Vibrio penaeicida TaxID=104609 RepID=UPI001CC5FE66|nr:TonB-dependent receptor [Vibrio penaeicida]